MTNQCVHLITFLTTVYYLSVIQFPTYNDDSNNNKKAKKYGQRQREKQELQAPCSRYPTEGVWCLESHQHHDEKNLKAANGIIYVKYLH